MSPAPSNSILSASSAIPMEVSSAIKILAPIVKSAAIFTAPSISTISRLDVPSTSKSSETFTLPNEPVEVDEPLIFPT